MGKDVRVGLQPEAWPYQHRRPLRSPSHPQNSGREGSHVFRPARNVRWKPVDQGRSFGNLANGPSLEGEAEDYRPQLFP
jgi:hypothetical protein